MQSEGTKGVTTTHYHCTYEAHANYSKKYEDNLAESKFRKWEQNRSKKV